jgi:hypothetical protein
VHAVGTSAYTLDACAYAVNASTPMHMPSSPRPCHPALITRVRFNTLAYAFNTHTHALGFPRSCVRFGHPCVQPRHPHVRSRQPLLARVGWMPLAHPRHTRAVTQAREQVQEVWDSRGCRRSREGMGARKQARRRALHAHAIPCALCTPSTLIHI